MFWFYFSTVWVNEFYRVFFIIWKKNGHYFEINWGKVDYKMSISPVSYSKSGNGEVIDDGSTQETRHVDVTESWNKEIEVRYTNSYSK